MLSSLSEMISEVGDGAPELQENLVLEEEQPLILDQVRGPRHLSRGVLSTQDALKAAEHGNSDILAAYLAAGGRPDAVSRLHHMGWSLLHLATGCALVGGLTTSLTYRSRPEPDCPNGFANCVSLLLAAGADPNVKSKQHGYAPLVGACLSGDVECCKLLLRAGASLEEEAPRGDNSSSSTNAMTTTSLPPSALPPPPPPSMPPPPLTHPSPSRVVPTTPQSPFEAARRARFSDSRRAEVLAVLENPPKLLPRSPLDTTARLLEALDAADDRDRSVEVRWRVPPSSAGDVQRYVVRGFVSGAEIEVRHDAVGPGGHVRLTDDGLHIQRLVDKTNEQTQQKRLEEEEEELKRRENDEKQKKKGKKKASQGVHTDDDDDLDEEEEEANPFQEETELKNVVLREAREGNGSSYQGKMVAVRKKTKGFDDDFNFDDKKKKKKKVPRQEWPGEYACHLERPAPPGRRRDFCENAIVDRGIALRQNLGLPVPTTASTLVHGLKPSLTYHFTVSCIAIIDGELRESPQSLPSKPLDVPNVDDDDWRTSEIIDKVLHYSAAAATVGFGSGTSVGSGSRDSATSSFGGRHPPLRERGGGGTHTAGENAAILQQSETPPQGPPAIQGPPATPVLRPHHPPAAAAAAGAQGTGVLPSTTTNPNNSRPSPGGQATPPPAMLLATAAATATPVEKPPRGGGAGNKGNKDSSADDCVIS
mmetsp:Transcript_37068/g.118855  ORF Transcript_37068/g.118855 Transcript_37068/m.118855 type:complete len:705 (-) Transcript_37068:662-2776(-)